MIEFITTGTLLGLSAGFSPGPLLALVISETLRHGISSGIRVALSPMLTDAPIILLTLFVLARLSGMHTVLGLISLAGGAVILFMGWQGLTSRAEVQVVDGPGRGSLLRGVLANALSPHPYLFWLAVGGPIMNRALEQGVPSLLCFVGGFYVALIGAKIALAVLVGRSRHFLSSTAYKWIVRLLGLALCALALLLFREGFLLLSSGQV